MQASPPFPAALILSALCGALLGAPAAAREVVDVTGAHVTVADHPSRIVTLAPSLGEVAADLAGTEIERIVGVSDFTDYPPALSTGGSPGAAPGTAPEAVKIPSIGSYAHFSVEQVLALKPDLVLATTDGNSKDQILHLREMKVPVVVVSTSNLSEIGQSMRLVGEAMGDADRGTAMAAQLKRGLESLGAQVTPAERAKPLRVLLELSGDPLIVIGKGSFLNEALDLIGARNVYSDSATHYPRPSFEDAIGRNPDAVVVLALGNDRAAFDDAARRWASFGSVAAVRAGRVHVLKADALLRPTLRFLEGVSVLKKALYDERDASH